MTTLGPAGAASAVSGEPAVTAAGPPRAVGGRPGWPLTALLVLYPLWWALGLGQFIVFILALPMLVHLVRRRARIAAPPGFGLWLLFLVCIVASTAMLGYTPPGTLPDTVSHRLLPVAFNAAGYLTATIVLLYAGNLTEAEFPRKRLIRQLGFFFCVVVAGGLLGVLAPRFEFTSPLERLLPAGIAKANFVNNLIHPAASQLQGVLGYVAGRPSAPFPYTNMWGYCVALLMGWFVVATLRRGAGLGGLVGALLVLAVSAVPIIYSLNRGLWIALGLGLALVAVRHALHGHYGLLAGLLAGLVAFGALFAASPLPGIVASRLDNPDSNQIRTFTTVKTLELLEHSPVLGFGSTRMAEGSAASIAIGPSPDCPRCGGVTLGSNGQLWAVLVSTGYLGAAFCVGFFLRSLWVYRRDRSPIGDAGLVAILMTLFFAFIYNALTMPLVLSFLSIALLWRNHRERTAIPEGAGLRTAALPGLSAVRPAS
jgi:hypothetical protein